MELEEIRNKITAIDTQIIDLIGQRFELLPEIIHEKSAQNIAIFQPEREKQMHQRYWTLSLKKKLNPELIRKIFELIIEESREIQEEYLNDQ